jgi:hypothetical protein
VFCGVFGDFKLSSGFEEERLHYACILSLVADNEEITVAKLGNKKLFTFKIPQYFKKIYSFFYILQKKSEFKRIYFIKYIRLI